MKKIIILIIVLIVNIIFVNRVYAEDDSLRILTKYQGSQPITYYNSDKPVKLPIEIIHKKQEFRGVFVDTENNLDIDSSTSIEDFKVQFHNIIQTVKMYNMNTIIFQVRPMNDAFYSSELNPWSRFLSGTEGANPGWDPLTWMIEEAHKEDINFYAGFNAFKVSDYVSDSKDKYLETLGNNNFAKNHPDLVLETNKNYSGNVQFFLNPSEKNVQEFILNSILELINNYNVDAIMLDNYYYPTANFDNIQDETLYKLTNIKGLSKDDWRRDNITSLVGDIKKAISDYNNNNNKNVQFGASVSGIWDNYGEGNVLGSNTFGLSSYDNHFADTREWVKRGYIDFIIPQVRWEFDHATTGYADVVDWWNETVQDTNVNLYIGHFINKYSSNYNWTNSKEIPNQLSYNQSKDNVKGSLFYNYINFADSNDDTLVKARDNIKNYYYNKITLNPSVPNLDNTPPKSITRLYGRYVDNSIELQWKNQLNVKEYIIYRFKIDDEIDLNNPDNIYTIIKGSKDATITYFDTNVVEDTIYKYFITSLDYANNESAPVQFGINLAENEYITEEILIFSIISITTVSIIIYSAFKVLRNYK